MKLRISVRNVFFWIACLISLVGAIGFLPIVKSENSISFSCLLVIIFCNVFLILCALFQVSRTLQSLLFFMDFVAFVFLLNIPADRLNDFFGLLLIGGFVSWLIYMGIKRILALLAAPFRLIFCRKKGIIPGTKWICTCKKGNSNRLCGYQTITFNGSSPSPLSAKGCLWSVDGKHNFEELNRDGGNFGALEIMVGHIIEWIGILVGFGAALFALLRSL